MLMASFLPYCLLMHDHNDNPCNVQVVGQMCCTCMLLLCMEWSSDALDATSVLPAMYLGQAVVVKAQNRQNMYGSPTACMDLAMIWPCYSGQSWRAWIMTGHSLALGHWDTCLHMG